MIARVVPRIALSLLRRLVADRRAPDVIIGGPDNPYMRRWWVWPRNRLCNLYLHEVLRDDDDRALHDHPWANASWVLAGGYFEHLPSRLDQIMFDRHGTPAQPGRVLWRGPGALVIRRSATQAHRLALKRDAVCNALPCWSLFFTGPVVRGWGFHCKQGWVHWRQFTSGPRGETVGLGCDQDWDALRADNDNRDEVARFRRSGAA